MASPGRDAVLLDVVRSPLGRNTVDGVFGQMEPVDLLAQTISGLLARVPMDPGEVDDIIVGCPGRVNGLCSTIGRSAWLTAGLPPHVPSTALERDGGSSQQAANFAVQGIRAGVYDVVIAAGIDLPEGLANGLRGPLFADRRAADSMARRWRIDRLEMDQYAQRSYERAAAVTLAGEFRREIVPIAVPSPDGGARIGIDESVATGVLAGRLHNGDDRRVPHRSEGIVHGGNAAHAAIGVAAMVVMSERRVRQLNLVPRARFSAFGVASGSPDEVVPGPIAATDLALKRAGLAVEQLDHVEIDETFAVVPLAWQAAAGPRLEFLNPRGGSLALGHPGAASGLRLLATMLSALEDTGGTRGLQAEWQAYGSSTATIVERL